MYFRTVSGSMLQCGIYQIQKTHICTIQNIINLNIPLYSIIYILKVVHSFMLYKNKNLLKDYKKILNIKNSSTKLAIWR